MKSLFCFLMVTSLALSFNHSHAQRYELIWSDEFDQEVFDEETWIEWEGTAFNNEHQYYTPRDTNVHVKDGYLYLVGLREDHKGQNWTSGRIKTENNFEFKYGKVEIRAKLPAGKGLWPAFWMLGDQPNGNPSWPYRGEIDIMEFRGHETNKTQGAIHFSAIPPPGSGNPNADRRYIGRGYTLPSGDLTEDFHLYQFEWTDSTLTWYMNDIEFFQLTREQIESQTSHYPFDQPFYLILNLAIGGDFLGNQQPDATTPDRNEVIVDYVRVYQDANKPPVIASNIQGEVQMETQEWIELSATINDEDGVVEQVEFYINDVQVASFTEAPYNIEWKARIVGCYDFEIKAYDDLNSVGTYNATLVVGPGCEKSAYNNEPAVFPGTLQLEHYDYGGPNVSYYDLTPDTNTGNAQGNDFRIWEAVDIIPDENEEGNYLITNTEIGEWTSYQIIVEESGLYDMEFRTIPGDGAARINFNLNGELLTYFTRINQNEENGVYRVMTKSDIELEAGTHILEMHIAQDGNNVQPDYIKTVLKQSTSSTEAIPDAPSSVHLKQNYPNPFNPTTTIAVELPARQNLNLKVFNSLGQHIATLHDGTLSAGNHYFKFDAPDLSSGLYYYQLSNGDEIFTRKMILMK